MVSPWAFRPEPWLVDMVQEATLKNPELSRTVFIHDLIRERNNLLVEVETLRKDNLAYRSLVGKNPEPHRPPSLSDGPKVECLVWGDMVPKEQCEECLRKKAVPHCSKVKGGSR